MTLLAVSDLAAHFFVEGGVHRAVDGVSFELDRGQVLCLVGESGSGKSVTALSILRLLPDPPGRIVGGSVLLSRPDGEPEDLVHVSEARMRQIRGDRVAMIFQDPMTSLNPYLTVGAQLVEVLEVHRALGRSAAWERATAMLERVGMPAPGARMHEYPHQLSGGMRQRAMIAMALLCEPDVLIADEPTTALDVTVQAQILELIRERKADLGVAVLLITHDLGVVARMADRVAVMYAGRIVEEGPVDDVFGRARHPYTRALRRSLPRLDGGGERELLAAIRGAPPEAHAVPHGCPFHPRCDFAIDRCLREEPAERVVADQRVRCHVEDLDAARSAHGAAHQEQAP
jgi:peptide/nickel transport system ATP-binding protein/oligopeptide transport system ATP-binding protein